MMWLSQINALVVILFIYCAVLVQAGGLADGTDVGTIVGNLWTPGKTNGVVNKASWDTVPANKWINVAGTRLDAMAALVDQVYPGWVDPSVSKWLGVTDAWNGVAYDEIGHRAWWVAAGGHGDSANNGIYQFDAFKMEYSVEKMPSDTSKWSRDYALLRNTITYTRCNESETVRLAKLANGTLSNINDWGGDELYWDNMPTSRHVYSGALYVREKNELVLAHSRLWRYSLTEHKWYVKVATFNGGFSEENIAHYDQVNDQVVASSCGSAGPFANVFNMSNNRWTNQSVIGSGWDWNAAADWRHNNTVTIFRCVEQEGQYRENGTYVSYDITTRKILASGHVQYGPGVRRNDFVASDGNGMVYVPPLNKYWVVQRNASGESVWMQLDPTTTPWTYSFLNFESPPPTLAYNKVVCRRMMWLPNLNAVLWLGSAIKNVSIIKLGEYVPVPPTTTSAVKPSTSTTTTTASATTAAAATTAAGVTTAAATTASTKSASGTPSTTSASGTASTGATSGNSVTTANVPAEGTTTDLLSSSASSVVIGTFMWALMCLYL